MQFDDRIFNEMQDISINPIENEACATKSSNESHS